MQCLPTQKGEAWTDPTARAASSWRGRDDHELRELQPAPEIQPRITSTALSLARRGASCEVLALNWKLSDACGSFKLRVVDNVGLLLRTLRLLLRLRTLCIAGRAVPTTTALPAARGPCMLGCCGGSTLGIRERLPAFDGCNGD